MIITMIIKYETFILSNLDNIFSSLYNFIKDILSSLLLLLLLLLLFTYHFFKYGFKISRCISQPGHYVNVFVLTKPASRLDNNIAFALIAVNLHKTICCWYIGEMILIHTNNIITIMILRIFF